MRKPIHRKCAPTRLYSTKKLDTLRMVRHFHIKGQDYGMCGKSEIDNANKTVVTTWLDH